MITSVKVDILDRVFHALVKLASPEKIMALLLLITSIISSVKNMADQQRLSI
jgi:hypothetical protein